MPQVKFDVLCIGHACVDLNFSIPNFPDPDEKLITNRMLVEGGGPAANAAFAIARLNGKAAFCGYVGNDLFGEEHEKELREVGVDTRFLSFGQEATPMSSVYVLPNGHRSIVNYRPRGRHSLPPQNFIDSLQIRCLLLDGHELAPSLEAIQAFPEVPSVLDAGSVNPGTRELYRKVTYLIASNRFACDFTGQTNPGKAVESLSAECNNVAVTCGDRGIFWRDDCGKTGHIPAHSVNAVDTTGAGDIFHGAFALHLSRGGKYVDALHYANKVASLACSRPGARFSAPHAVELQDFAVSAK